jgi:acetyl esterase
MDCQHKLEKYNKKYFKLKNFYAPTVLEPATQEFIDSLKDTKPLYDLSPKEARDVLDKIQIDDTYKQKVDIEDINVMFDKKDLSMTIFRPKNNYDKLHTLIYVHGGGWILGNKQVHGRLVSDLAIGANIAVVFINYTLAPEAQFLVQLQQLYSSIRYICLNSEKYNLLVDKLMIAGDSVGGNMASSLIYISHLQGNQDFQIKYQILMYPVTSSEMSTPSYKKYQNGPWLTKNAMEWFFNAYVKSFSQRTDPKITLLNIPEEYLRKMPPGLIIVADNDVLRDEGELYAYKLIKNGVNIFAVRVLGTMHDFMMLNPLKDTSASMGARDLVINQIKKFTQ